MCRPSPGLFDSASAEGAASAMAHVTKRIAELLRMNPAMRSPYRESHNMGHPLF
jgi:hypothetical protein